MSGVDDDDDEDDDDDDDDDDSNTEKITEAPDNYKKARKHRVSELVEKLKRKAFKKRKSSIILTNSSNSTFLGNILTESKNYKCRHSLSNKKDNLENGKGLDCNLPSTSHKRDKIKTVGADGSYKSSDLSSEELKHQEIPSSSETREKINDRSCEGSARMSEKGISHLSISKSKNHHNNSDKSKISNGTSRHPMQLPGNIKPYSRNHSPTDSHRFGLDSVQRSERCSSILEREKRLSIIKRELRSSAGKREERASAQQREKRGSIQAGEKRHSSQELEEASLQKIENHSSGQIREYRSTKQNDQRSLNDERSRQPISFDIPYTESLFWKSLIDNEDIDLGFYILGYEELYKFCRILGSVFKLVGTEIRSKVDRLKYLRENDTVNFSSMKSMVLYELSNDLMKSTLTIYTSGCRTFNRLDRGLEFLVEFLKKVYDLRLDDPTNIAGCEAYTQTLGRYHSWLQRKSAIMLLNLGLPTKRILANNACGEDPDIINEQLPSMLRVAEEVHRRAYTYFKERSLLSMP